MVSDDPLAAKRRGAKRIAAHVLFEEVVPHVSKQSSTSHSLPESYNKIAFRAITNSEATNLGAPLQHLAAVNRARSNAAGRGGMAPVEALNVTGEIIMQTSQHHDCTQVTLTVSLVVPAQDEGFHGDSTEGREDGGTEGRGDGGTEGRKDGGTEGRGDSGTEGQEGGSIKESSTPQPVTLPKIAATASVILNSANTIRKKPREKSRSGRDILGHFAKAVANLHARLARYDEVDDAMLRYFETEVVPNAPPLKPHETDLLNSSLMYDSPLILQPWKRIPGTINDSVAFFQKKVVGDTNWGKAIAQVDAPAVRVVSDIWSFMSYGRIREDKSKNGNLLRKEIPIPDSHSKILMSIHEYPGTLSNRVFSAIWCWRKETDGSFTLAFEDSGKSESFGDGAAKKKADTILETDAFAVKSVRAWSKGFYRVVPLAPSVCKVTFVMQASAGGLIPLMIINYQVLRSLSILKRLQDKYERNGGQVDAEMRSAYPTPPLLDKLNPGQASVIKSGLELGTDADIGEGLSTLPSLFPFVDMWMTYARAKKRHGTKGRSVALGKARTIVDCSALTAAKWMFAYGSRCRMMISAEEGNPARLVVEERTPYDVVVATIKTFPFPLSSREFVARQLCVAEEGSSDIIMVATSVDDTVDYGMNIRVVRGSTRACFRFSPINDTQCSVTLFQYFDTRGLIPVFIVNFLMPTVLSALEECRTEFERDDEIDASERANLAQTMEQEPQDHTEEENELLGRVQSKLCSLTHFTFKMSHIYM
jgi:hypothetical protein